MVLLTVATTLLAHGAYALIRMERAASVASGAVWTADRWAEAEALRAGDRLPIDSLPVGGQVDSSGPRDAPSVAQTSSTTDRLSAELWRVVGRARTAGGLERAVGTVAWTLDPETRTRALAGWLAVGRGGVLDLASGSAVSVGTPGPDPMPPDDCPPWAAAVMAEERLTGARGALFVADSVVGRLGWLTLDRALERASTTVSGSGTPRPTTVGGVCSDDPWNWGAPGDPGPCGARTVLLRLGDGAMIHGGIGQGVFLAEGDVTLVGATLHGVVWAGGVVTLEAGSRVFGLVRATGGASLSARSQVVGDACWAAKALATPRLRDPIHLPSTGWFRVFEGG